MENRIILPFFVQGGFCNEFEEELTTSHFEFTTKARFFDLSAAGGDLYEVACALAPTVVPAIAYIIHGWIKKKTQSHDCFSRRSPQQNSGNFTGRLFSETDRGNHFCRRG
ncbi:hypothetical protein ABT925_003942 [Salmonella enterica subsp. enterica serovar Give]